MAPSFDVISDLALLPTDNFDWTGKAESLYCIVAGNVSSDLHTIQKTLIHLSRLYQGVFYITGSLEYQNVDNIPDRTGLLGIICSSIQNVSLLYNHVVIIDGVAVLGANGWYGTEVTPEKSMARDCRQADDQYYLRQSINRLQLHLDVTKILVVTNSVPKPELYFGEEDDSIYDQIPPAMALSTDTMKKVTHWVYGSYHKEVDVTENGIHYVNNAKGNRSPYWAKRITV